MAREILYAPFFAVCTTDVASIAIRVAWVGISHAGRERGENESHCESKYEKNAHTYLFDDCLFDFSCTLLRSGPFHFCREAELIDTRVAMFGYWTGIDVKINAFSDHCTDWRFF